MKSKRKKGQKSVIETGDEIQDTRRFNYIDIIDISEKRFFGMWYHELNMRPVKPYPTPIIAFIFWTRKQAVLAKKRLQQGLNRDESDEAKSQVSFTRLDDGAYLLKR